MFHCRLQMLVGLSEIDAGSTLVIQMLRFENPTSTKYNGDICDFPAGLCDPAFRFSLDQGNRYGFAAKIYFK